MHQIVTSTKKLQLLEQTNEIEEEERERAKRNLAERTAKYNELKSQNDILCIRSANKVDLKQESTERRALLLNLKECVKDSPWMKPFLDILENQQGFFFCFKIVFGCSFSFFSFPLVLHLD